MLGQIGKLVASTINLGSLETDIIAPTCSNGSGKTSLAVSILWALTGTTDSRPSQDYKVSDVVNDSSKVSLPNLV